MRNENYWIKFLNGHHKSAELSRRVRDIHVSSAYTVQTETKRRQKSNGSVTQTRILFFFIRF